MTDSTKKFDMNAMITDQVIKIIEDAEKTGEKLTWKKFWDTKNPKSFVTKKEYRGINTILLGFSEFASEYWLTWKQATDLGGTIKDGQSKNYRYCIFWKFNTYDSKDKSGNVKTDKNGNVVTKNIPMMRYYQLYNLDQWENIPANKIPSASIPREHNIHEESEAIINGYKDGPKLEFGGGKPCYIPSLDTVQMPPINSFHSPEAYYETMYHELIHSTGHDSRLSRDLTGGFGRDKYSKEELIAELGSAFLAAKAGINQDIENKAAYLNSWLGHLKNDKKLIISASQAAQKATDRILGISFQKKEDAETETAS